MKEHPIVIGLAGLASIVTILTFLQLDVDWRWEAKATATPQAPVITAATSTQPSTTGNPPATPTSSELITTPTLPDSSACVITIVNPLVPLREQPENFGQEIRKVPVGDYTVTDTTNTDFAGKPERWLQITVEGRTGWVQDSTMFVESKSAACQ